jgi:hypothetical protein
MNRFYVTTYLALISLAGTGCSSSPPPASGFLSGYSNLKDSDGAMRFVSPKLKDYNGFIIDPVQMSAAKNLNEKERAEVAGYFSQSLAKDLTKRGYRIGGAPAPGVGRIRVAITDIQESKWYLNVHPASKLTGAGTGGASMEGEIVDSQSGDQLGAVIQAGKGSQFELDTFSKLDDVKDTIDKWVQAAGNRLDNLRKGT